MTKSLVAIPVERVEHAILRIRGEKVILDADLAKLYAVSTKRLNEQVKRNRERFPEDFMFQLTIAETRSTQNLRSHFATLKRGQHTKYRPFAFTEHGAIIDELERKYDGQFQSLFAAIRELMSTAPLKAKPIGFRPKAVKK